MARLSAPPAAMAVEVPVDRLDDFRLMLREQLLDDNERLRDIAAGVDPTAREPVADRVAFVWSLASQVGGVF